MMPDSPPPRNAQRLQVWSDDLGPGDVRKDQVAINKISGSRCGLAGLDVRFWITALGRSKF